MGQLTDTCEILGLTTAQNVRYMDQFDPQKGIAIEYTQGGICEESEKPAENGQPRRVVFQLQCADYQDSNFIKVFSDGITVTKCSTTFLIHTPAGCKTSMMGGYSYSKILFYIIVVFACYVVIGMQVNQR